MQYKVYFKNNSKGQFTKIDDAQSAAEAKQKTLDKIGLHIEILEIEPQFDTIKKDNFIDFFNEMINRK